MTDSQFGFDKLFYSIFAIVFFVLPGAAGLQDPQFEIESSGRHAGVKAAFKTLYELVGPLGMLMIGLGIVLALIVWWFFAWKFPPNKRIATASTVVGRKNIQ